MHSASVRKPFKTRKWRCRVPSLDGTRAAPSGAKIRVALMKQILVLVMTTTALPCPAGDPQRGQELYESRCMACHSMDANRVGPKHRGVFGRRAGTVPGYDYSQALSRSDVIWNAESLDQWLADPEAMISGQRMNYSVTDAMDRSDIIAYLKEQSTVSK